MVCVLACSWLDPQSLVVALCFIRLANFHLHICCAGVSVTDFYGFQQPAMTVNGGATVTLEECVFIDNLAAIRNETAEYFEFEVAAIAQRQDTIIRLQNCEFGDGFFAVELITDLTSENSPYSEVLVISDPYDDGLKVSHKVKEDDYDFNNSTEYSTVDALTVPAARRGIESTSPWFQRVQKVRLHSASPLVAFIGVAVALPARHS
jgi:hypothetical protein